MPDRNYNPLYEDDGLTYDPADLPISRWRKQASAVRRNERLATQGSKRVGTRMVQR